MTTSDSMAYIRIIDSIKAIIERCTLSLNIEFTSIVLYGSKARGDRNSQNDYEVLLLVKDDTPMLSYIRLNETLKIELLKEKLFQVKIVLYTPETFEKVLYYDSLLGTFLYIICKENIILYDRVGTFSAIKEKLARNEIKDEEEFLNQCIGFARMLGSEKWERKWEKALMQHKYLKNRRTM